MSEEKLPLPPRLTFEEYGGYLAFTASLRATCRRQIVGCVLFNSKRVVKATGFNGAPPGAPQCDDVGCLMIDNHCARAVHAERNAVLFSGDSDLNGGYAFITIFPCRACFDLLAVVGIKHIFFLNDYRNKEHMLYAEEICLREKISVKKLALSIPELLDKAMAFHKGPGGLFAENQSLRIIKE